MTPTTRRVTIVLICCIVFQGLLASKILASPLAGSADQPPLETRVYARSQCLLGASVKAEEAKFLGAIAGILVPILLEKGLEGISAALRKAGSPETLRDSSKLPTYLYQVTYDKEKKVSQMQLNPQLGCLVMVRGRFQGPDPSDGPVDPFSEQGIFTDARDDPKRITRLHNGHIPVQEIAAEYEAAIVASDDGTALRYESRFLQVEGFQGSRGGDTRALIVSLAISAPAAKEDDGTLSLALVDLGKVKKGTLLGPDHLSTRRSGWLSGIGITDAALKAIEKMEIIDGKPHLVMPVTVDGAFTETDDGNKFLVAMADVLSASKSDLAKAISKTVLPAEQAKAAQEAADALEKKRQDEEQAYSDYLAAVDAQVQLKEGASESERNIKKFNVEKAQRAWCLKYSVLQKLGVAPESRKCPPQ